MSPPKLKQLLLARCLSLQGWGDRRARPDLVGGAGSDEIARQLLGRAPRPITRSIGFSFIKNYESGESKVTSGDSLISHVT